MHFSSFKPRNSYPCKEGQFMMTIISIFPTSKFLNFDVSLVSNSEQLAHLLL